MLDKNSLKTFFLFPQKLTFQDIAEVLVADQNEAFLIHNHVEFKDALKIFNKNSIAFINIDSVLSESEWIDYVKDLRSDPDFSKIKIGILSFNPDKRLIDIYKTELKIECGYHILSSRNKQYEKDIIAILKKEKSKEAARLLRLDFDDSNQIYFTINHKSQVLEGNIDALSTAAMSITIKEDVLLTRGMELDSIQIHCDDQQCKLQGTVVGNSRHKKNQFVIKFNTFYSDLHQQPLFKIIHEILNKEIKELIR